MPLFGHRQLAALQGDVGRLRQLARGAGTTNDLLTHPIAALKQVLTAAGCA
jgi:hypothetical protein